MDKKIIGIVIVLIVIALIIFSVMLSNKKSTDNNIPTAKESVNPIENMPETNPFETEINPMEGYINPFAE